MSERVWDQALMVRVWDRACVRGARRVMGAACEGLGFEVVQYTLTDSCLHPLKYILSKFDRRPISVGRVPLSFSPNPICNSVSLVRSPSSVGSVPESFVEWNKNFVISDHCPFIGAGIVPVTLLQL